jgi:regulator of CtrA degradation
VVTIPETCASLAQNRPTPELSCVMFESSRSEAVPFGRNFVSSEAFRTMFRQGMHLVEETAAYLDGPGREESRTLPRDVALAYATESMRLTTRLMQIASWLLVQRAVSEGEITPDQARTEKNRVKIADLSTATSVSTLELLPQRLRELMDASQRMQARVLHLETLVTAESQPIAQPAQTNDALTSQMDRLKAAFGC